MLCDRSIRMEYNIDNLKHEEMRPIVLDVIHLTKGGWRTIEP